jgi:predicted  nucleic acid-binding Zn ribbon protein
MTDSPDYSKLYPPGPTPGDEICSCPGQPPIKLMEALGYNPIHCMDCNLEVRPESLRLGTRLVEWIADWRGRYAAIDRLWLDSREYEEWAAGQLRNIHSPVNEQGRELQRALNEIRRCYYWYFQETIERDRPPISSCPACGKGVTARASRVGRILVCEECSIVAAGS